MVASEIISSSSSSPRTIGASPASSTPSIGSAPGCCGIADMGRPGIVIVGELTAFALPLAFADADSEAFGLAFGAPRLPLSDFWLSRYAAVKDMSELTCSRAT